MAPPSIVGEPVIKQEEGSVIMTCMVKGADQTQAKWFLGETELTDGDAYKMSSSDEGGGRLQLSCEIMNFDKPLAGEYKCEVRNGDGPNHANFTVTAGNAPDFTDKPHIVQREGGKVVCIKVRGKSTAEGAFTADWYKDDKIVKASDRIKLVSKPDDKDKSSTLFVLEIHGPQNSDQAKYKCVLKNPDGQNSQSLNLQFD